MNRLSGVFLSGLIGAFVLCGCGGTATSPATIPSTATAPSAPASVTPLPSESETVEVSSAAATVMPSAVASAAVPVSPVAKATVAQETNREAFPVVYGYQVVNVFPHDPAAFTQGLIFEDGLLYEGTGLRGRSSLRQVELETGRVIQGLALPPQFFGEGVTVYGDRVYQLTWKSNLGFVYDRESFELLQDFTYPTEGWGLTHDGKQLIMSDGSAVLHFLDLDTLQETGQVEVRDQNGPVLGLNELEYVQGEVYANVWKTDRIARIDPVTGQVMGWILLAGLLQLDDPEQHVDVLNGIAYDVHHDRLFVTGKLWPKMFEIELVPETVGAP